MLCALGTATFAAVAAPRRQWLIALAVGFLSTIAVSGRQPSPDPEVAGLVAAAAAVVYLFRPRYAWFALVLGGSLAGMLIQVMGLIGAPQAVTAPLMATGLAAVVWHTRKRQVFAPEMLREEALLIVCILGLLVAVLPSVLDGWQAAANLNVQGENVAVQAIPMWTLTVVAASMLLGIAHAFWSRR
jgi:hypothetical protein